jgi:hypothetical protein
MKIIKNKRRKRKALVIIGIRKEYRNEYIEKRELDNQKHAEDMEEMAHFFEKNLRKQAVATEKKYRGMLDEKDDKIKELNNKIEEIENKFKENKEIFKVIKQREQDLENVMSIVGNKFKGFAELIANGYASVQNSFSQVEGYSGYNKRHLKHDAEILNALNTLED